MIGHDHHLLAFGQIDPDDRVRHRDRRSKLLESCVPVRSLRETPLPVFMNVLLMRWDTKPEAHQGDVPNARLKTLNVFLWRNPRGRGRSPARIRSSVEAGVGEDIDVTRV